MNRGYSHYSKEAHRNEAIRLINLVGSRHKDAPFPGISDGITRRGLANALLELHQEHPASCIPNIMLNVIYNDLSLVRPAFERKSDVEKDICAFKWIPYYNSDFVNFVVKRLNDLGKKDFIDVGSGLGTKAMLARIFGKFDTVSGVELNDHTYEVGLFLSSLAEYNLGDIWNISGGVGYQVRECIRLVKANALEFDYGKHDAAYLYMPISDNDIRNDLHLRIINTMPVGGTMIEVGRGQFGGETKKVHTCEAADECSYYEDDECTLCKDCCDCERKEFTWAELCGDKLEREVDIHRHNNGAWEITVLE